MTNSVESVATSSSDGNRKRKFLSLEPVVLFTFFAWNVASAVFQDQIVFQVCTVELGYNRSNCSLLGKGSEEALVLEKRVQPYATDLLMTKSLVEALVSAFFSLFIGPWSDKYGRKPMLVAASCGFFLTYLTVFILSWASLYAAINPWYYVLASIFIAVSGGTCTLITGIYCYIADVTTEKDRAVKMGVVEAALFLGLVSGSFSSSYFYQWLGGTFVMGLATLFMLFALLWNVFYVEESKEIGELDNTAVSVKIRELFRFELVSDMMKVCFKRRPDHDRTIIWLIMLSLGFSIFIMEGNTTVYFLFVREQFDWDVKLYTIFSAIATVSLIFGNFIAMYGLKRIFNFGDSTFAIIAFASALVDSVISAVAFRGWHLYLSIGLTLLKGLISPMCRSILASTSEKSATGGNEIGKIFSLTTSLESILAVVAVPIYSLVYRVTLETYPGAFNIISAVIYTGICICMSLVFVYQRMYRQMSYGAIS